MIDFVHYVKTELPETETLLQVRNKINVLANIPLDTDSTQTDSSEDSLQSSTSTTYGFLGWKSGGVSSNTPTSVTSSTSSQSSSESKSTDLTSNSSGQNASTGAVGAALRFAASKVGRPYVWGAKGKDDTYDCSGLVYAAYKAAGVKVPSSTKSWKNSGKPKVDSNSGQPGDVIILNTNGPSGGHAMMITNNLGNGKYEVVEARGKKWGVVNGTYTVGSNLQGIYRAKKGLKLIKKNNYGRN